VKAKPLSKEPKFVLNTLNQSKLDSIKNALPKDSIKIFSFNPNFITDYKGYSLGISPEELDRLFLFRQKGKFVNSAKEFQNVTQISDSLLNIISPLFKFPAWKR